MHNRDNTAFENHTVLGGILAGWNLSFDYLLWHIPTYCALGIVFSVPGKRKTLLNLIFHWEHTHLLFFLFKNFFFPRWKERNSWVAKHENYNHSWVSVYKSNCRSLDPRWKSFPTRISIWPFQREALGVVARGLSQ